MEACPPSGMWGEQKVQSELKTNSCHTKSKLLARPWRTSPLLPLPFLFLTRVAHRRFRVLTHCSLKCPFVRTLPLLPDSTQTPNLLGSVSGPPGQNQLLFLQCVQCGSYNCIGQVLHVTVHSCELLCCLPSPRVGSRRILEDPSDTQFITDELP